MSGRRYEEFLEALTLLSLQTNRDERKAPVERLELMLFHGHENGMAFPGEEQKLVRSALSYIKSDVACVARARTIVSPYTHTNTHTHTHKHTHKHTHESII